MDLEIAPVIGERTLLPDDLDAPYWDALGRGELRIQRCRMCEEWIWAPRFVCPSCHTSGPDWERVEARGRVYSWVRTWHPFAAEFADLVPYITVLVELPHAGGRRILGILLGDDSIDPSIGDEVQGAFQPPSDRTAGAPVLRWERVPGPPKHDRPEDSCTPNLTEIG